MTTYVRPYVYHKIMFLGKTVFTVITLERFLACLKKSFSFKLGSVIN